MSERIVIVGNGISGVTAARFIRKSSDASITIVSSESPHFFARTALMYAYMGSIRDQDLKPYEDDFWIKNRIDLVQGYAITVDTTVKIVRLGGGDNQSYDSLILATGSKPVRIGWKGEELPGVQSLYSMQDLALMRRNTNGVKRAAVIGGGLTGVEVSEMLRSRGIEVVFGVRSQSVYGRDLRIRGRPRCRIAFRISRARPDGGRHDHGIHSARTEFEGRDLGQSVVTHIG